MADSIAISWIWSRLCIDYTKAGGCVFGSSRESREYQAPKEQSCRCGIWSWIWSCKADESEKHAWDVCGDPRRNFKPLCPVHREHPPPNLTWPYHLSECRRRRRRRRRRVVKFRAILPCTFNNRRLCHSVVRTKLPHWQQNAVSRTWKICMVRLYIKENNTSTDPELKYTPNAKSKINANRCKN